MNKKGHLPLAVCQSSWDDLAYPKMQVVSNTIHTTANALQTQDIACVMVWLQYYSLFYHAPLLGQRKLAWFSCGTIRLWKALTSFLFSSLEVLTAAEGGCEVRAIVVLCPGST